MRHQKFEIKEVEMKNRKCVQTIFFLYWKVLKDEPYPKLLISQSKIISGPSKYTLRHQKFEIKEVEMKNRKCAQTIFFLYWKVHVLKAEVYPKLLVSECKIISGPSKFT